MKTKYKTDFLLGILCGAIIYIIDIILLEMVYFNLNMSFKHFLIDLLIAVGVATMVFTLLRKRPRLSAMLIRFFSVIISYILFTLIVGYFEIIPFMEQLLNFSVNSMAENVSGMLSFFFMCAILISSAITIVIYAIIDAKKQKRQYSREGKALPYN